MAAIRVAAEFLVDLRNGSDVHGSDVFRKPSATLSLHGVLMAHSPVSARDVASPPTRRRGRRISLPLLAFGIIFAGWWSLVFLLVGIDPLDLYPWGLSAKLRDNEYGPDSTRYLVDVVAKDPSIDTILIGGSTSAFFTRQMMNSILPGTKNGFNLSYQAPRVGERALVTAQVMQHTHAKHVLLAADWIYALRGQTEIENAFPGYLYDDTPLNDIRMVNIITMRVARAILASRSVWLADWDWGIYQRSRERSYRRFQTVESMNGLRTEIEKYRNDTNVPSMRSCADFDAVNDQLIPFAKALSAKHIALDIFFPPYSLAFYYDWIATPSRRALLGSALLNDQLRVRRCLVEALAGMQGVRIFAFDNEDWLTGDLKNYSDTAHVFDVAVYRYMLKSIAEGSHRLTMQTVDADADELRRHVKSYTLTNSNFGKADVLGN